MFRVPSTVVNNLHILKSSLCIHPLIMTIYYIRIKIFYISNGLVPAGILLLLRPIKKHNFVSGDMPKKIGSVVFSLFRYTYMFHIDEM